MTARSIVVLTLLAGAASVPDIPVHSIVVDPTNARRLYLGTDLGVMISLDGGFSWAVENTGFATAVTEWLALGVDAHGDPWLFAFTHGRGAWKVALNPIPSSPREPSGRRTPLNVPREPPEKFSDH